MQIDDYIEFHCEEMNNKAKKVVEFLQSKYGEPSIARNRMAFFSKHVVIKFPLSGFGLMDNDWENSVSCDVYAKTKRIEIDGFECVMMEKLKTDIWQGKSYDDFPSWVGGIDCGQVGYDKHGILKAFDWGRN